MTLFCPSRGRPQAALELERSFRQTVAGGAELVFCVDEDDSTLGDYPPHRVIGPSVGNPTYPLNRAALQSSSAIIGFIGDDSRCETPGWDVLVERVLRTPGFCWGFDGTNPNPWPSTVFISREIIQVLGYMVPPSLKRGFFDIAWIKLAQGTMTERLIEASFPHDNSKGDPSKPNFDPKFRVPPEVIAQDEQAFAEWTTGQFRTDIRILRHLLYS